MDTKSAHLGQFQFIPIKIIQLQLSATSSPTVKLDYNKMTHPCLKT